MWPLLLPCRRHDITKIDRPVQPLELLRYLTELVASLVQRLPRAEPAPLPRQLAAEPRGAGSVLAGGGGGSAAALVAQVPSLSLEAEVQCVGGSRRSAVVLEELDYDTLCQLVADEQAQDIEALMLELGAAEEHSAEVVAAAAAPAAVAVSAPTADGGSAKLHSSSDAASSWCSRSAAHARGAAEQPTSAACATPERAGSGSDSSNGGSGFTERVAQQVLGLQQQMSKALASLRRSSSSCSSGSTRAAGTASGAADTDATVAAGMVSAEQDAYAEPPLAGHLGRPGQQLSKEPLGALCDTLGPGRWRRGAHASRDMLSRACRPEQGMQALWPCSLALRTGQLHVFPGLAGCEEPTESTDPVRATPAAPLQASRHAQQRSRNNEAPVRRRFAAAAGSLKSQGLLSQSQDAEPAS